MGQEIQRPEDRPRYRGAPEVGAPEILARQRGIAEFERLAVLSLRLARFEQRTSLGEGVLAGQAIPFRDVLRSIFGRNWVRKAAFALKRSEAFIARLPQTNKRISNRDLTRLLATIRSLRSHTEAEWREARVAAGHLFFEWAREAQRTHLDAEMRRRLKQFSLAEAWIRDVTPNSRRS